MKNAGEYAIPDAESAEANDMYPWLGYRDHGHSTVYEELEQ